MAPKLSAAYVQKAQGTLAKATGRTPKKPKAAAPYSPPKAPLAKKAGVPQLRPGALTGGGFNSKHPRDQKGRFARK